MPTEGAPNPVLPRKEYYAIVLQRELVRKEKQEAELSGLSGGISAERAPEWEQKQETNGPLVLRGALNDFSSLHFPSSL